MRKSKRVWLILILLGIAYIGLGLSRFSFSVDILRLLPTHLRQVEGLSLFLKHFSLQNELIISIDAGDSESAELAATALVKGLRKHSGLIESATAIPPWEENPANLAEFLTFLLLNQPPGNVAEVRDKLAPDRVRETLAETIENLNTSVSPKEIALLSYDPFGLSASLSGSGIFGGAGLSEFSSEDGHFRVVYARSAHPFSNYKETSEWLKNIKEISTNAVSGFSVDLGFTGEPAFVAEISNAMQWDMMTSAMATLGLISLIFWLCYGKLAPLRWLLLMLLLTFLLSLATAGLFLKEMTIIGAGFASVMIGLSVDYGYLIYQQSLNSCGSLKELRWNSFSNIAWTASTTAAVFFALNISSMPGISQLGNMVGIGICIGALVMLALFAPIAFTIRCKQPLSHTSKMDPVFSSKQFFRAGEWVTLVLVLVLLGSLAGKGFPKADFSAATFRTRNIPAQGTLEKLYARLTDDRGYLSLIVRGDKESDVLNGLKSSQAILQEAKAKGLIKSFFLPLPLWPDESHQRENLALLANMDRELPRLKGSLLEAGFTDDAFALTQAVFEQMNRWQGGRLPVWPENETSQWILRRLARHGEGGLLAMGMVEPVPGRGQELSALFQDEDTYLVSWSALGAELQQIMPKEILWVTIWLSFGILVILALGLGNIKAVMLFAATTILVLISLAGAMSLFGMTWGFFNLAAVLLLLGTGTDYTILLLLALKRNGGDTARARKELGLVIFLCCTSAAAGFGSLSWANNAGLAALGKTCALGLLIDGMISLFLLPKVWDLWMRPASHIN